MKTSVRIILYLFILSIFSGCNNDQSQNALKQKMDKYISCWNTGSFDGIEELLHQDFELIQSPDFEVKKGIESFKQTVRSTREACPDFKLIVNEMVFGDDKCAGIWRITATDSRTNQKLNVTGMSFIHFKDGKIKDEWIAGNDLNWLVQLGYKVLPPGKTK